MAITMLYRFPLPSIHRRCVISNAGCYIRRGRRYCGDVNVGPSERMYVGFIAVVVCGHRGAASPRVSGLDGCRESA